MVFIWVSKGIYQANPHLPPPFPPPSLPPNTHTHIAMPDFLGKIHTAALKRANESHKKQVMGA